MILYFNIKTAYGVETVDFISKNDFATLKEFRTEKNSMLQNYRIAGMPVYISQRSTKEWRAKK
jgi:hypothetical protein